VSVHQKKAVETVFETGTSLRVEDALTFAGRTYWFDHILTPLRDADNTIQSVLGISRDISKRKRMETALQESEEKYRAIINRANDVICIIQDGIIKMCNPLLTEFWGSPAEEILGRPFTDFVHPDAISEIITNYNRRMSGESLPSIYETTLKRKDGSRSYVEVNAVNIMYEGKIADLVIVRDMNERKKAEEALHESEQLSRRLLEQSFDAIAIHKEGKIAFVNEKAVKILRAASPEDIVGKSIFEFVHPDSRKDLEDRIQKLRSDQGTPVPVIIEKFIRTDGSTATVEVLAISFDDNGTPAFRVAFREISSP
jgi:two-component system sporulation sensor kinase A